MIYSYKKERIIQDSNKKQEKSNNTYNNIKNIIKSILNNTKNTINNTKEKYNNWKNNIDWKKAGHNTATIIKTIMKYIPVLLIIYSLIQTGLFISTKILPLTPWFEWGWNSEFISKLPVLFQPTKFYFWLSQAYLTAAYFFLGCAMFSSNISTNRKPAEIFGYCKTYTVVSILLIALLFFKHVLIVASVALFLEILQYIRTRSIDDCFIPIICYEIDSKTRALIDDDDWDEDDEDWDDEDDTPSYNSSNYSSYTSNNTSKKEPEPVKVEPQVIIKEVHIKESAPQNNYYKHEEVHIPETTFKIINAKQIAHCVHVDVWEFLDGKKGGTGKAFAHNGILQNWNESSVTIKDGKCYRQYGTNGAIINTWIER